MYEELDAEPKPGTGKNEKPAIGGGGGGVVYEELDAEPKPGKGRNSQKPFSGGGGVVYEELDAEPKPGKGRNSQKPFSGGGGVVYEELDAEPKPGKGRNSQKPFSGGGGVVYEELDAEPKPKGQVYNTLRETEIGAGAIDDPSVLATYSKLERSNTSKPALTNRVSQANNPTYSDPNAEPIRGRTETSPPAIYAQPDMTKKQRAPPKPPRANRTSKPQPDPEPDAEYAVVDKKHSPDAEYAVVDKKHSPAAEYAVVDKKHSPDAEYAVVDKKQSPAIPSKSAALLDQLNKAAASEDNHEGSPAATEDVYTEPVLPTSTKVATLTKSAISSKSLSDNPLYASADGDLDDIYATPGPAAIPEPNPSGNIYEQIYNAPSLSPSSFMKEPSPGDSEDTNDDLCPYSSIYTVPVIPTDHKPLIVTKRNIEIVKILGSGNFGDVMLARTVGLSCQDLKISNSPDGKLSGSTDTNVMVSVAVKMLKPDADITTKNLFEKEHLFMSRLNHPNVVSLLGVCNTDTPFIMMEYMENGDLNYFLQMNYDTTTERDPPGEREMTLETLIHFCTQIASAMQYLASKNFVHRDLATRNCLVGNNFHVKLADFGMSRSLYESHYYVIKGHAILPIRWMATECFYGKFSAKSDVWAFGVTMWEIFELAKNEPYHEIAEDRALVRDAIKGADRTILSRPAACPEEVYQVMRSCWVHEASGRATFEQLHQRLSSL